MDSNLQLFADNFRIDSSNMIIAKKSCTYDDIKLALEKALICEDLTDDQTIRLFTRADDDTSFYFEDSSLISILEDYAGDSLENFTNTFIPSERISNGFCYCILLTSELEEEICLRFKWHSEDSASTGGTTCHSHSNWTTQITYAKLDSNGVVKSRYFYTPLNSVDAKNTRCKLGKLSTGRSNQSDHTHILLKQM